MLAPVAEELGYLSKVAHDLGMPDPVRGVIPHAAGQWQAMRGTARLWRATAGRVENASRQAHARLGGVDASWEGADAQAFLAHMNQVATLGHDLVDGMRAVADVLDQTADAVHTILTDLRDVITDGAESVAEAVRSSDGADHVVRERMTDVTEHIRELAESIQDALDAFARFCEELPSAARSVPAAPGLPGVAVGAGAAGEPTSSASASVTDGGPAATVAASESGGSSGTEPDNASGVGASSVAGGAAASGTAAGGMGMGMMPMGMMGGMRGQQGNATRQNSSRFKSSPEELFGKDAVVAPSVFGADEQKEKQETERKE